MDQDQYVDAVQLGEAIAREENPVEDEAPRRKRAGNGKDIKSRAAKLDAELSVAVSALADRERRRRGHDTTVTVRRVDPATLQAGRPAPSAPLPQREQVAEQAMAKAAERAERIRRQDERRRGGA